MFEDKSTLQHLLHENPNLISGGILEISPFHNAKDSTPLLVSLGKDLSFNNTVIDNVLIDAHGVMTLVACQLYGSTEFSRNLYTPIVNFAADLRAYFRENADNFEREFDALLQTSGLRFTLQNIIDVISQDPFLNRYELSSWRKQFKKRLQQNLQQGYVRLVIICAPNMSVSFDRQEIENLMRSMTFSEAREKHYDLVLLDLRQQENQYHTSMVWRGYSELPHIPIIEKRLTQIVSLENTPQEEEESWAENITQLWDQFSDSLLKLKISMRPNTYGYSLNRGASLYILVCITPTTFFLRRDRIIRGEYIYEVITAEQLNEIFPSFQSEVIEKKGRYSLRLHLTENTTADQLINAVNVLHG